jgi:hypothetical protein
VTLDYFYGAQADQFAFYRIPKALFTDERFKSISAEAKILYGILLDRMSLSRKNGWTNRGACSSSSRWRRSWRLSAVPIRRPPSC